MTQDELRMRIESVEDDALAGQLAITAARIRAIAAADKLAGEILEETAERIEDVVQASRDARENRKVQTLTAKRQTLLKQIQAGTVALSTRNRLKEVEKELGALTGEKFEVEPAGPSKAAMFQATDVLLRELEAGPEAAETPADVETIAHKRDPRGRFKPVNGTAN